MNEDTKPTNPKDRAATDRLDLSLFPDSAVAYGALAMVEGDSKYGGYNYRVSGVLASIYIAALRRHIAKWWNGEEIDPKTQVPHLANAIACLAVIIDAKEHGVLKDDRPPEQNMEEIFAKFEGISHHLHELFNTSPGRFTNTGTEFERGPRPLPFNDSDDRIVPLDSDDRIVDSDALYKS